jgi:hypothetical protein
MVWLVVDPAGQPCLSKIRDLAEGGTVKFLIAFCQLPSQVSHPIIAIPQTPESAPAMLGAMMLRVKIPGERHVEHRKQQGSSSESL